MRNIALFGRRELEAHRLIVSGVTASTPKYKAVDAAGNKEYVVDVYLGPLEEVEQNIIRDVLIAPYAKQLIGDIRQPVTLERSKQGKYTVIGRDKSLPAGLQTPEGSILEPTYHKIQYNLAELQLSFIADLDYESEVWGEKPWGEYGSPWQDVRAIDAFGNQVAGLGSDAPTPLFDPTPATTVTTRHVLVTQRTWGPGGNPDALKWGASEWGASLQKTLELTT